MAFVLGSATITGVASATAQGDFVVLGDANASATATVTADAVKVKSGTASFPATATATADPNVVWSGHAHADGVAMLSPLDLRSMNLDESVVGICGGMVITEHPPDDPNIVLVDQECVAPGAAPAPPPPPLVMPAGILMDHDATLLAPQAEFSQVALFPDTSGNGWDFGDTGAPPSPLYRAAALNGFPALDFGGEVGTGSRHFISVVGQPITPGAPKPICIMCVADATGYIGTKQCLFGTAGFAPLAGEIRVGWGYNGGGVRTMVIMNSTSADGYGTNDPIPDGPHVFLWQVGPGGGVLEMDGVPLATFQIGLGLSQVIFDPMLGTPSATTAGSNTGFDGLSGRTVAWDRELNPSERSTAYTILKNQFGL